jgi:uridine kinase
MAKLADRYTLPYGPLAQRTGDIHHFSVISYEDGMVLRFPDRDGRPVRRLSPQPRLFGAFRESQSWNELIGIANLAQLNRRLMKGWAGDLIRLAEGLHEKKIVEVADLIASRRKDVRLILLSGPSSSGKTTTSKRLGIQLHVNGIEPVTISLDNYYRDPDSTPRHPDGTLDFEHLEALDLPLLQDHLRRLIAGEQVDTPVFDFRAHRRRTDKTLSMQLQPSQVLVMEGIHALNPAVSQSVPRAAKFKLFVSALTQLTIDEHNRIFTSDTRLMRRIVRDRLFRAHNADETIKMWDSVRQGEQRWIFPFQEDADVLFNSALIYEQAVMTTYARRFLPEVPRESPSFVEADRLRQFIDLFIPILPEEVPPTSVLREFIGGSVFEY